MSKSCTSATAEEKTCTTAYSDQHLGRRKDPVDESNGRWTGVYTGQVLQLHVGGRTGHTTKKGLLLTQSFIYTQIPEAQTLFITLLPNSGGFCSHRKRNKDLIHQVKLNFSYRTIYCQMQQLSSCAALFVWLSY